MKQAKHVIQIEEGSIVILSRKDISACVFEHYVANPKRDNYLALTTKIEFESYGEEIDLDRIRVNDTFTLNNEEQGYIYNSKTRKMVSYLNGRAYPSPYVDEEQIPYIGFKVKYSMEEELTMYYNSKTLETKEIYSKLQDRIIPVMTTEEYLKKYKIDDSNARVRITLENEIKKYIRYIREIELIQDLEKDKEVDKKLTRNFKKSK